MRPYVVTEDVEFLMQCWAREMNFRCPESAFFQALQSELFDHLRSIFPEVVSISHGDMTEQLRQAIARAESGIVVSIDRVYNQATHRLQSNRIADLNSTNVIGEAPRPGHPSLQEQISLLPAGPLTLVDDGCFSGVTLNKIHDLLVTDGHRVCSVIVGVLIDRSNNEFLAKHPDVKLIALQEFPEAIDWICERDFFIGVPLSGRTGGYREGNVVTACDPEVALPYCIPFGDPVSGASIPADQAITFSKRVLQLSRRLWEEVGRVSDRPVLCRDIPRLPRGVSRGDEPFIDALDQALQKLRTNGSEARM